MAKKILKDPNLSKLATRMFGSYIDVKNDDRILAEGAHVGEMIKLGEADESLNFEVELVPPRLD